MIKHRKVTESKCPNCKDSEIEAIEYPEGRVIRYWCPGCKAEYDVYDNDTIFIPQRGEFWYVGKLRNPKYWELPPMIAGINDIEYIAKGLEIQEERGRQGIVDYLGKFPIEKIPND